jgi:hypothetical protein
MAEATKTETVLVPEQVIPALMQNTYTLEMNQVEAEFLLEILGSIYGEFEGRDASNALYGALERIVYDKRHFLTDFQKRRVELLRGMQIEYGGVG